ncbi:dihydroorotate dehydrogenase electron transfer subunit, partial [Candidatus Nanopelagicales bacterium]|nr:dihydroorotate dehydrogenase electron transfer subunit [Candidatus Nanopelagicales bacterium]
QQIVSEILDNRRVGDYHVLSLTAPGVAESVQPGHFVTMAMGGEESSMVLRRAFAIHQVTSRGVYGGTLDVAIAVQGRGTKWLSERRRHDIVNLVGPLGRPFTLPKQGVSCVLVGGGYGSAPLFLLAQALRDRGCRVDIIVGAATEDKLFGVLDLKRLASGLTITTDDGSSGVRGRVTDVLDDVMDRAGADVVYACGPMPMLAEVARISTKRRVFSQCAVEEAMACGIGVCMTCVLPVVGDDGVTRMVRSCVDGPVFRGDRVRWQEINTIPADAVGAPEAEESA